MTVDYTRGLKSAGAQRLIESKLLVHPETYYDLLELTKGCVLERVKFGDGGEHCPRCIHSLSCMARGVQFYVFHCRYGYRVRARTDTMSRECSRLLAFPCIQENWKNPGNVLNRSLSRTVVQQCFICTERQERRRTRLATLAARFHGSSMAEAYVKKVQQIQMATRLGRLDPTQTLVDNDENEVKR